MNEGLIARRYAKALLKFTGEHGDEALLYNDVKRFEENQVNYPGLRKTLQSPVMSARDKETLLASVVGPDAGDDFLRFARLVIKNRRENYFRAIGLMYQKLYRDVHQIVQIRIITAVALDEKTAARIRKLIEHKAAGTTVDLVYEVDPVIVGGFVLKVGSTQMDASINNELKILRLNLLNSRRL